MHEMSIAEGLLQAVLTAANQHGATRIERIELDVGQMRLIVPDAMQMAWQVITEGTIAAGSEIVVVEVPVTARCKKCGRQFAPQINEYICPDCGQADVDILTGDDIILKSVVCDSNEDAESGANNGAKAQ